MTFAGNGGGDYVIEVEGATGASLGSFDVVASGPAAGSAAQVAPTTFQVDLSESVLLTSVDATDLIVTDPGGGTAPASGVTVIDGDTLSFDIAFSGDGSYTFDIAGVR